MLTLNKIRKKNKKGISIIVAYVILITISIALAVLVYNWLKFYVSEKPAEDCPDEAVLVIKDYNCISQSGDPNYLNLTLQNKGLFTIDGFIVRVNNKPDSEMGFYVLNNSGTQLKPGVEENYAFYSNKDIYQLSITKPLTFVDVQSFVLNEDGKQILCGRITSQKLEGC